MKHNFILLLIILFSLSACTTKKYIYAMSTKEIKVKNLDLTKLPRKKVDVEMCEFNPLFWVPLFPYGPLDNYPSLNKVVDKALKEGNGDLLINAKVNMKPHWITMITRVGSFSVCTYVEGTVINTKGGTR